MLKLRVGIGLLKLEKLFDGNIKRMIESIRTADEIGVDQVSLTDHVVMGENVDRYPYGKFPMPLSAPWYEPITVLSAIAVCTKSIRLSTGILIAPLRPAVLLAKQLATLDVIAEGRLEIGVGVGWQQEEYIASGIPFEERYRRLDDQLHVCKKLWSEAPVTLHASTVKLDGIRAFPRPPQGANLPFWFGIAPTPRNCRRIAELGEGWIPMSADPVEIKDGVDSIRSAFAAVGRDPRQLQVRAHLPVKLNSRGERDLELSLEAVAPLREAGVTVIEVLPTTFCRSAQELPGFYEKLVDIKG